MKSIGVIPARFRSTRFPGKPLALIAGKPLLQWVIEGSLTSQNLEKIIVATDHEEIFSLAQSLSVEAKMTDSDLPSGSDRVWQAVQDEDCDVVVNIQGDEPLIKGEILDQILEPFADDSCMMSTLGHKISSEDIESSNTAKIVLNHKNEALYFSRWPIPYSREKDLSTKACLKHIGLYAYRKSFLKQFCESGPVALERAEGLEQLRALYWGAKISVVEVDHQAWGVDRPEDVLKIESILKRR